MNTTKSFENTLNEDLINKIAFDNIDNDAIKILEKPTYNNLMKVAIDHSDALIIGSNEMPKELESYLKDSKKPVLDFKEKDEFAEAYTEFYNTSVLQ